MKPGEIIRHLRKQKKMKQRELAEAAGLKQGTISDIERGRQLASRGFLEKVSGVLNPSPEDVVGILGIGEYSESDNVWPATFTENHGNVYDLQRRRDERRLPENAHRRKLLNSVIKILESGNQKAIKAIESNIEAFEDLVEARSKKNPHFEEGD